MTLCGLEGTCPGVGTLLGKVCLSPSPTDKLPQSRCHGDIGGCHCCRVISVASAQPRVGSILSAAVTCFRNVITIHPTPLLPFQLSGHPQK